MPGQERYEHVLRFWFGDGDANVRVSSEVSARWWKKSDAFDQEIRQQFLAEHEAIHKGQNELWLREPRGRLAYVIVLDQFSRNMFRGTAKMFASDARALAAALSGIEAGDHTKLGPDERAFLYMPLMHSESLAMQNKCVELFGLDHDEGAASSVAFAVQHRDIIARFGRFPHRNEVLVRVSTPEEEAFLRQPGSSF